MDTSEPLSTLNNDSVAHRQYGDMFSLPSEEQDANEREPLREENESLELRGLRQTENVTHQESLASDVVERWRKTTNPKFGTR